MKSYILAINQGLTGTRALIFDERAHVVARGLTGLQPQTPQEGYAEQDAEAIYQNMLSAVHKCIELYQRSVSIELEDIKICGIASQRETIVLWDKSGTPLSPAILSTDERSADIAARIKETKLSEEIIKRTGLVVDPIFSATKIKWLYENDEELQKAIDQGKVYAGTIDAWLLYKLTNGKRFYTDYTNASRTLLFNIDKLQWDSVLLRRLGFKSLILPDHKPSAFDFGETTFNDLFPHKVKITAMIGESQAAAFGHTCFMPGDARAAIGSGSSILMNTGSERVTSQNGLMTTLCWSLPDRVDYALEGFIASAGATIDWLRHKVGLFKHPMETEKMANSVADNNGVYFVPAFTGLGAPHGKRNSCGLIAGLGFSADINHIVRAALESIPYQIKDVILAMEADSKIKLKELHTDGGVTGNNFIMQFIADLLTTNIRSLPNMDVAALGAAYLAGLQAGVFNDLTTLKEMILPQRRFVPGDKRVIVQDYYKGWKEAVQLLR